MSSMHSDESPGKQNDARQNLIDDLVLMSEDEARRRREQLNRRPSYRMILKDLETVSDKPLKKEVEDSGRTERSNSNLLGPPSDNVNSVHFEVPTSTHLTNGGGSQSGQGPARNVETPQPQGGVLRSGSTAPTAVAVTMRNQNESCPPGDPTISSRLLNPPRSAVSDVPSQPPPQIHTSAITQHILPMASSNGLSSLLPVNNDMGNMKNVNELISHPTSLANYSTDWSSGLLSQQYTSGHSPHDPLNMHNRQGSASVTSLSDNDDGTRKRQVRLMKNREAAKECRRKKKEYVKCLENRVAVLENQNKALIEELKTLKELYCRKEKSEI